MSSHSVIVAGLAGTLCAVLLALHAVGLRMLGGGRGLRADLIGGNHARSLVQAGHVLGVFIMAGSIVGAGLGDGHPLENAPGMLVVGVLALVLHGLGRFAGVRILLGAALPAEVARGNAAAGLAAGAHSVATALLISKNIAGSDVDGLPVALTFFAAAQVCLYGFTALFRACGNVKTLILVLRPTSAIPDPSQWWTVDPA